MSGLLFWLPVVKMSWEKNSKKKPILLVNFCFLIHIDFSNTRIFSFSVGIKVMNPKMPLCQICPDTKLFALLKIHPTFNITWFLLFSRSVSNKSFDDLSRTSCSWLDQHVNLVQLRPLLTERLKVKHFQSQKRLYIHKCPFVHLSVKETPQQLEIIILHHSSSTFIILHSSFLNFATFKLVKRERIS